MTNIRLAEIKDTSEISSIHVRAWQKAYHGLLPQKYLDGLSISERQAMWAEELSKPLQSKNIFVIEVRKQVRGFIVFSDLNSRGPGDVGEIYAINIDPIYWHQGLGSSLLNHALGQLQKSGFDEAILWVLPTNKRAIRFYESQGWNNNGYVRSRELFGINVEEVCYLRNVNGKGVKTMEIE